MAHWRHHKCLNVVESYSLLVSLKWWIPRLAVKIKGTQKDVGEKETGGARRGEALALGGVEIRQRAHIRKQVQQSGINNQHSCFTAIGMFVFRESQTKSGQLWTEDVNLPVWWIRNTMHQPSEVHQNQSAAKQRGAFKIKISISIRPISNFSGGSRCRSRDVFFWFTGTEKYRCICSEDVKTMMHCSSFCHSGQQRSALPLLWWRDPSVCYAWGIYKGPWSLSWNCKL